MVSRALGEKLFISVLGQVLMVWYLFPDYKGSNRWCPGQIVSLLMLLASFVDGQHTQHAGLGAQFPQSYCCLYHPCHVLPFPCSAAGIPYCDTLTEGAFYGASKESDQNLRFGLFDLP